MGLNTRMGRTEERRRELKARTIGRTPSEPQGQNIVGDGNELSLRD